MELGFTLGTITVVIFNTLPSANLTNEYKGRWWSHTMQVTIRAEDVILIGSLLAALGGIGGLVLWCVRFVDRQKRQDRELAAIRKEQTLICYGVKACLQGLRERAATARYPKPSTSWTSTSTRPPTRRRRCKRPVKK